MESAAIMNESESIKDWIIDIRRELHRFPELMYEEHRTNALVREKLDELGIDPRQPCIMSFITDPPRLLRDGMLSIFYFPFSG